MRGIDPLAFLGMNDANIRLLEEQIAAQILARGNEIILRGNANDVELAVRIVTELLFMLSRNGSISEDDIRSVTRLAILPDQQKEEFADVESVILYTKSGVLKPRTEGQQRYFELARNNDLIFAIGPAGTGKTFLAVAFAVARLRDKEVDRIILCRPAVEAGESLGFLPGDFREKVDPYLRPLYDALYDMVPLDKLKRQMESRIIEIVPLAYMRGRTLNNSFVILDEAQNTTSLQMKMFLTRLGANSRAIITGDITQIDLPNKSESGLVQIQRILKDIDGIEFIYLTEKDVVRHPLVRKIIVAYEKFNEDNGD
jgi:phosphate starvation-inducible PhoH-like protein